MVRIAIKVAINISSWYFISRIFVWFVVGARANETILFIQDHKKKNLILRDLNTVFLIED